MERLQSIANHLRGSSHSKAVDKLAAKHPDDVVITLAVRSPLCKARKGGFKDVRTDELMTAMFKATIERMQIDPKLVEDICVGNVLPQGPAYAARASALAAGFPETTPVQVINRFCSSGLMAVQTISNSITNNEIEIGLAMGVESMSDTPDKGAAPFSEEIMAHPVAKDCIQPMGWTSENVSADFNISRERIDQHAALSHQRAEHARSTGRFKDEIVPLTVPSGKGEARTWVTVTEDDGIRAGSTPEALAKIRPAFPQWGNSTTTGGNASQITDGAASVLLMKRSKAEQLGVPVLAKYVKTVTVGLAPRIMGIGPSIAIPKLLESTGLQLSDLDLIELNEAFGSMSVYCIEKLGLDIEKVNVNGGAIALGHPLGCTGARQIATGLAELRKRKGKVLATSMCIGLGMGAAGLFILE